MADSITNADGWYAVYEGGVYRLLTVWVMNGNNSCSYLVRGIFHKGDKTVYADKVKGFIRYEKLNDRLEVIERKFER